MPQRPSAACVAQLSARCVRPDDVDQSEARSILREYVLCNRSRAYEELRSLIDAPETRDVTGPSGAVYQIETQILWDDRPGGNLRVLVSIDDRGLRAIAPLTDDFIISSSGAIIGE